MKTALMSLVVVAVAGVPGIASAATVSVDGSGTVQYQAAAAEANVLQLVDPSGPFTFADTGAPLTAGSGCTQVATGVSCPAGSIAAALGDGNDLARVNSFAARGDVSVDAGTGDDDVLAGSNNDATANGGAGNDILVLITSAAGTGNGGSGDDQLAGRSLYDTLSGGPGSDLLAKRAGRTSFGLLSGNGGPDRIVATGSGATTDGGDGNDLLIGGVRITGGGGADRVVSDGGATIDSGAGNDIISAADGGAKADTITCGPGLDLVWADPADVVAGDCEMRFAGPAPTIPGAAQALADAQALLAHKPAVG